MCQITPDNIVNYLEAREAIATALHLKLVNSECFQEFPKAETYITAVTNNSDRFKLLYRIIEISHPLLRSQKGDIHTAIAAPKYSDAQDNSIYIFITRYKKYITYEELTVENRTYNKIE